MVAFYHRPNQTFYEPDSDTFSWIPCDFCKKYFPSDDGSAFVDDSLNVINFDQKVCCNKCLNDNVDDAWLSEVS